MDDDNDQQIELKHLSRIIESIHTKVMGSAALNGGFDKLSETVECLSEKVNDIHNALYEPDEGLYARVKASSAKHAAEVSSLTTKVEAVEKWTDEDDEEDEEFDKRIKSLDADVSDIKKNIQNIKKIITGIKWVGITTIAAIISALAKNTIFFLSQHITLK